MTALFDERLSVAPMMELTDGHFRRFARCFTKKTVLYTEMIPAQAVVYGDAARFLNFTLEEKPLVLQFGGSDPEILAKACAAAGDYAYDAVNLNAGCPSSRVAAGNFGAMLMSKNHAGLLSECLCAMVENAKAPVTVKTRIAIQDETQDSDGYGALVRFVQIARKAGVGRVVVHARKARLNLSPKQNRERPDLRYDLAYALKRDFPDLSVVVNGDVKTLEQAREHLNHVDGAMTGREFYANPYAFADADRQIFNDDSVPLSRGQIVRAYLPYMEEELAKGAAFKDLTCRLFGLFKGVAGAGAWRRELSEEARNPHADTKTVAKILNRVISTESHNFD